MLRQLKSGIVSLLDSRQVGMLSIFATLWILTDGSPFSRPSSVWNDVQTSYY